MQRLTIDTAYLAAVLARLLNIPSPTGYTDTIVREVCLEIERLGLSYELTRRGAIRAVLPGRESKPARALIAHVDTLGAQVKRLKENGRLELVPIGTWSARFAEGARATIFAEKGAYRGTILPLKASGHIFNDEVDSQPTGWPYVELRVDALARSPRDLVHLGIDVGDTVAIDPQPEFLHNGFIVSRHLDDKGGVAILLAALKALKAEGAQPEVDTHFVFTIAEETGVGASAALANDVASIVAIDNGTTGPGQNSDEFGVTIAMADQTGPFDFHLTQKLVRLCRDNDIRYQKDIFRFYRSDSASAVVAGHDVRAALITFGIDASHGYERIHMHALRSIAELVTAYVLSPVEIRRDAEETSPTVRGFTRQPMDEAEQQPGLVDAPDPAGDP
ncbi:hydrolase, peptidase M42 family [Chelatococcus sambhunathii]|uniref:Peptidase M42 n=2 Tax=Chelatococcus TaxID=28209 RepID=A0AAC9JVQ8_9HYPH|nr:MULTISPECIES: osmoprotectant NAGGN system M42 family peptidase [Chelatococcus]APF38102.1 peptidase M42 [Chelatococcus daeguensis]CUA84185.1 hydrolase, peptidase M42 family [Chelatococcus sambhunathii]